VLGGEGLRERLAAAGQFYMAQDRLLQVTRGLGPASGPRVSPALDGTGVVRHTDARVQACTHRHACAHTHTMSVCVQILQAVEMKGLLYIYIYIYMYIYIFRRFCRRWAGRASSPGGNCSTCWPRRRREVTTTTASSRRSWATCRPGKDANRRQIYPSTYLCI
jgi:hypothetical protein